MKILFDDIVPDHNTSITSTYESSNYPASNLKNDFAKLRYQMTLPSGDYDTVTIQLDGYHKINSFYLTYSSAHRFVVRFYDDASLLKTSEVQGGLDYLMTSGGDYVVTSGDDYIMIGVGLGDDTLSDHFDYIYANKIEIDVYGTAGTYLGKFACGESVEFPDPLHSWTEGFQDYSTYIESPDGQTQQQYYKPLKQYRFNFVNNTRAKASQLRDYFLTYGTGRLVYIDVTEDDSEFLGPMYGKISQVNPITKQYRWYNMGWNFKEAR